MQSASTVCLHQFVFLRGVYTPDWRIDFFMEKQYILFDLDGTLTDSMEGITKSVQYALRAFGIEVEDHRELSFFVGPPLKESFQKNYHFTDEEAEEAVRLYREYYRPKGIFENTVYEGIPEMLEHLCDAGKTLLVATSKPTDFAEQILEHFDLDQYFDFVAGATMDQGRTKKADVIAYLLEEYQLVDTSELIMVGDRSHDVLGAKELGIPSVGVLYGYGSKQELKEAGADYIVRTVAELEELLLEED